MAPPPSSDKPSSTRSSQQNFVDLKVYVPCVEINGRSYISHNGEIFGPAQQAIGRQSRVHHEQLYQEDFSDSLDFRGMNDSNDVAQEEIKYHHSPAVTLSGDNNTTKNFDGSYQHTVESAASSIPHYKPATSKKRFIDSCPVQEQSSTATDLTKPKKRRINSPDIEQKTTNRSSHHVASKCSGAGLNKNG
ncbi:hypothetical protein KCU81_g6333, partial [Aureobasidium melanogenum]